MTSQSQITEESVGNDVLPINEHTSRTAAILPSGKAAPRPKRRKGLKRPGLILVSLLILTLAGFAFSLGKQKLRSSLDGLRERIVGTSPPPPAEAVSFPSFSNTPWDGIVRITADQRNAIGFRIEPVLPQTEPIHLELNGTTDYNQNTLTRIRPRFDSALVEKVFVSSGQHVKKGDPLLELKSADLAAAKNDCRTKLVQWDHDHKNLVAREPLARDGLITRILWTDTQNDEKKSRLDYLVARDKLATYGMTGPQIDQLLEGLSDDRQKALEADDYTQDISRITIVSPIDGIVVERDVVPGNFYDTTNILLVISPMTELWVWGNVFESDQDKVHLGQKWDIVLQYSNEKFPAVVESIAKGVDLETKTLRIRASISNIGRDLKARMLVRAILQVPPLPGDTVIPRQALAVFNGESYAFVQKGESGPDADRFERRKIEIEQEGSDIVVVRSGLKAGERVVSNGSLILSQMFEDQSVVDRGLPAR
ncbi:efflux RND transporter periplasmic adaptor subunit [Tundrisphaera lichenicola]|uniref:efflux RND transporter periplasmic adaptor subunit n=1 Tax=Tundrisphaera lichenicola TaxID=2029860 RepID=UPI003EB76859